MRQLDQGQNGGQCIILVWKKKSRMFRGDLLPVISCAMFVTGLSVVEGNQSVNNKEQRSVSSSLRAREEGLFIDVYQTAEFFDLLLNFTVQASPASKQQQMCRCMCTQSLCVQQHVQ